MILWVYESIWLVYNLRFMIHDDFWLAAGLTWSLQCCMYMAIGIGFGNRMKILPRIATIHKHFFLVAKHCNIGQNHAAVAAFWWLLWPLELEHATSSNGWKCEWRNHVLCVGSILGGWLGAGHEKVKSPNPELGVHFWDPKINDFLVLFF